MGFSAGKKIQRGKRNGSGGKSGGVYRRGIGGPSSPGGSGKEQMVRAGCPVRTASGSPFRGRAGEKRKYGWTLRKFMFVHPCCGTELEEEFSLPYPRVAALLDEKIFPTNCTQSIVLDMLFSVFVYSIPTEEISYGPGKIRKGEQYSYLFIIKKGKSYIDSANQLGNQLKRGTENGIHACGKSFE
jgi:hypothetical protein